MSSTASRLKIFDDFLLIMDEQLECLERDAGLEGLSLDRSMACLDRLEELYLKMAAKPESSASGQIVYFARYLGEVVINSYGGNWKLPLGDKKNVNYDTPVVVGHSPVPDLEFAPFGVVRSFSLRKKIGLFRSAILAQVKPEPIDLTDLPQE